MADGIGLIQSSMIVGAVVIVLAVVAVFFLEESYGKDLDYLETDWFFKDYFNGINSNSTLLFNALPSGLSEPSMLTFGAIGEREPNPL